MKKTLLKIFGNKIILASIVTFGIVAVAITSCTKSSNTNYASQFVGTWTITSSTCGSSGSFSFAAGSGSNSLTTAGSVGSGSCYKAITLNGTASANSFVFSPQTFTDACGNSYTLGESGTISGGVLTATATASGALSINCTVTATK